MEDKKEEFIKKYGNIGADIYCALKQQIWTDYPMKFAIKAIKWILFKNGYKIPADITIRKWRDNYRREWEKRNYK